MSDEPESFEARIRALAHKPRPKPEGRADGETQAERLVSYLHDLDYRRDNQGGEWVALPERNPDARRPYWVIVGNGRLRGWLCIRYEREYGRLPDWRALAVAVDWARGRCLEAPWRKGPRPRR